MYIQPIVREWCTEIDDTQFIIIHDLSEETGQKTKEKRV